MSRCVPGFNKRTCETLPETSKVVGKPLNVIVWHLFYALPYIHTKMDQNTVVWEVFAEPVTTLCMIIEFWKSNYIKIQLHIFWKYISTLHLLPFMYNVGSSSKKREERWQRQGKSKNGKCDMNVFM